MPKISEKIAFHLPMGGQHAPTSPALAPPLKIEKTTTVENKFILAALAETVQF